jgi:precorrin-2 dehydrogenase/sirohydrochlorin ferrochelatase
LDLTGKAALVVGGGNVAERKVRSLLKAEAEITVVSPELTSKLQEQLENNLISCEERNYQSRDIENKFLAIGATDSSEVNRKVAEDALALNLLVNIIDQPQLSNFNVPASVRQGSLCLSVSTDGNSPALSRRIRKELETNFGPEYGEFLEIMGELRSEIIQKVPEEKRRKEIFRELAYSKVIEYMREGNYSQVEKLINDILPEKINIEREVRDEG